MKKIQPAKIIELYFSKSITKFCVLFLFLMTPEIVFAGSYKIGETCRSDSDCLRSACQSGSLKDNDNNPIRYCTCQTSETSEIQCESSFGVASGGKWQCTGGSRESNGYNFCHHSGTGAKQPQKFFGTGEEISWTDAIPIFGDSKWEMAANLLNEAEQIRPELQIRIPGLNFNEYNIGIVTSSDGKRSIKYIPWLEVFIAALYKFLISIVSIVAVTMIVVTAGKIIVSGGKEKAEGYKKIIQILSGAIIAWCSYAILFTLNRNFINTTPVAMDNILKMGMPLITITAADPSTPTETSPETEEVKKNITYKESKMVKTAADFGKCSDKEEKPRPPYLDALATAVRQHFKEIGSVPGNTFMVVQYRDKNNVTHSYYARYVQNHDIIAATGKKCAPPGCLAVEMFPVCFPQEFTTAATSPNPRMR